MSLKDELDVRVRKYQSENPVPSSEEIEDEAKACAARQWKKLRKKFLLCQKKDKGVIIFVGTIGGNSFIYKEGDLLFGHRWTQFGRIRYYPETMKWLRRMAEEEGLRVIENYSSSGWDGINEPPSVCWRCAFAYDKPSNSKE